MSRLKKTKLIHCKIHKCADFPFTIDKLSYDKHVYTYMLAYLKSGLIGKDYFLIKKESVKEEKINYNDNIRFTDASTTRKKYCVADMSYHIGTMKKIIRLGGYGEGMQMIAYPQDTEKI